MFKKLLFMLMGGLLLAVSASQAFAQESSATYNREVYLGTTLGAGFNPRLIYKKAKENSATRFLLRLNSNSLDNNAEWVVDNLPSSSLRRDINLDLGLGIGKEWRSNLLKNFQAYYGGDIEALYATAYRKSTRMVYGSYAGTSFVEGQTQKTHSPGLALGVFAGFRYVIQDRISFSAEAGPRLSASYTTEKISSTSLDNLGTPDEQLVTRIENRTGFSANFRIISPLYLQFAVHF